MKLFFKKVNKGFTRTLKRKHLVCGFTLVEALVAISIFSVSLLGLLAVLSQGIANTGYAKRKVIAAYLAQEGIEYIRNMRDTSVLYDVMGSQHGWDAFKVKLNPCNLGNECGFDNSIFPPDVFKCSTHGNQCKLYLDNGNYNANSLGNDSGFVRKIWMETAGLGQDQVKISSKVEWTQGSGNYNITFSENLFNWVQ